MSWARRVAPARKTARAAPARLIAALPESVSAREDVPARPRVWAAAVPRHAPALAWERGPARTRVVRRAALRPGARRSGAPTRGASWLSPRDPYAPSPAPAARRDPR